MSSDSFSKRVLSNPALGLFPYLVFSILIGQIDTLYAFALVFGLSILPFIFRVRKELRVLYDISAWSFLVAGLVVFVFVTDSQPHRSFILAEVSFVIALMIFRLLRKAIIKRTEGKRISEKRFYLHESIQIAFHTQYVLTFHLIAVLGLRIFSNEMNTFVDTVFILNLFQVILATIIIFHALRLRLLHKRLKGEEWLPVISESGAVQGRIAKSVSISMKNKFLHPLVRIALIHNGMLYLKDRDDSRLLDPGKLDYPFETYMQYNHKIEEGIKNAIRREIKTDTIPVRFILKYVFENESTKRLVFLYVSTITSEIAFNNLQLSEGKLWTTNQIDDNIDSGIFSETFELEYEYLKNTVLMAGFPSRKTV